jgi:chromosome segregation ATPase
MSGLFELRELVQEKQKRLHKVMQRLSLEQGGIQEKLKFKARKLRKGKEEHLNNLKTEIKGVESKYEREEAILKQKLKNAEIKLKDELDALDKQREIIQRKHSTLETLVEEKLEALERKHTELLQNYYHPKMNSLYESEEELSEEDISLPLAYHKLKSERNDLEGSIKLLLKTLKEAEEKEQKDLLEALEARNKKAPKAPAPVSASKIEEFKQLLEDEWMAKKTRMRKCQEPLLPKDHPFWREGERYLTPGELKIYQASGGIFETTQQQRQSGIEDRERAKELEEVDARNQAEAYRTRVLEREKQAKTLSPVKV